MLYVVTCSEVFQENYQYLVSGLTEVASRHNERVLRTPHNDISIGKCYYVNIWSTVKWLT